MCNFGAYCLEQTRVNGNLVAKISLRFIRKFTGLVSLMEHKSDAQYLDCNDDGDNYDDYYYYHRMILLQGVGLVIVYRRGGTEAWT